MHVLLVFLDGVGLGPANPRSNPFVHAVIPTWQRLLEGGRPVLDGGPKVSRMASLIPADAQLGVSGLPQSGTGQTALITGINAPARTGRHVGPYPDAVSRDLIQSHSIFKQLKDAGFRVAFANAFPDRYLDRMARGTGRASAISRAAHMAGVPLRGPAELRAGKALSAFLTNQGWRDHLGYRDVEVITPFEAGRRLSRLALDHDFTLFEYYHTDMVGHRGVQARILDVLEQVDQFLQGILEDMDEDLVLIVASDHGNIEDWSTTDHTLNPALVMVVGAGEVPAWGAHAIQKITDVVPAILHLLNHPHANGL